MSWFKRLHSPIPLRLVLIVPFVLQTVGAVTLVGYLSYRSGQQTTKTLANQLLHQNSERISDRLDHYLDQSNDVLTMNRLAVEQGNLNLTNKEQLQRQLWQQMLLHPSLSGNFFSSERGEHISYGRILSEDVQQRVQALTGKSLPVSSIFMGTMDPPLSTQRKLFLVDQQGQPTALIHANTVNIHQLPWYRYAKATGKQSWTPIDVSPVLNVVGMWSVAPIYQPTGELQGVFAAYFPLSDISTFLRDFSVSPSGQTFILERSGDLVATSTLETPYMVGSNRQLTRIQAVNSQDAQTQTIAKQLVSKLGDLKILQTPQQLSLVANHQRQFVQITPYEDPDGLSWLIVTAIPESDFLAETERNTQTTALLCLLTLGLAIASGLAIANRLTNSITRLNRASHKLAAGDLTQRLPAANSIAEMQGLTQSFNQMADQLAQSFDQIQTALEESEAKFTIAFRTSPDPISILTLAEGRILEANDRLLEFCGYSREEVIGQTTLSLGIWKTLEDRHRFREKLQTEGKIQNSEMEFRLKSGILKTVLVSAEIRLLEGQECVICAIKDISDRKRAEEALRQSETRYLSILEEQTELIKQFKPDGTLIFVNDAFCRYYGLSKEALIGKSYKPPIYPEDQPLVDRCLAGLSPKNPIGKVEHRVLVKGTVRWMQWTNQVIYDDQGNLIELQSVGRDIHDRKQAEIALRKALQELNYHIENSPLATIRWDNSFRVEYWSKQAEEIFGWTSEEVLGKTMHDWRFIMEDDLDRVNQVARQMINGMGNICRNRNYHKDGSILYCEWYNSVLFDESGNLISMLSLLQDVTDRERVKQALQESQTKLQRLVDNIGEKFVIFSHAGAASLVTYVSDGFASIFGIEKEAVLGKPWLDSINWLAKDLAMAKTYVSQAINEQAEFQHYEMRFVHPDGAQRTLYVSQHPVRDQTGHLVAIEGIVEDITERKQAEANLSKTQAVLLEAQRIGHIGNWEFDILSQKITWSSELFHMFGLDPTQDTPDYADYLQMIHPDDRRLLEQLVKQAVEEGTAYVIDYRAILADGSIRYHEGRAEIGRNDQGQITRLFGTALDITERKQIEQTLQTSEARFRAIFEQAAVGINQADASGRYVAVNQYFCDLLGYSKEEILTLTYHDLTHPGDLEQHISKTAQLLQGKIDVLETEIRYRHKNGDWVWTSITLSVIRDKANNVIGDLAIVIDIRDRKQAEAALKAKTEELDQFFSVALDLLCIANINGYFLRLNPQWEKTLGYRTKDLEGSKFLDYVHPDDIESTLGAIANFTERQEIPIFVNRYRCRDGSYRSLEWRSFPLGNLIFSAARDVTERKQLEQDLIKNRDFRELLFNESNDALFLVDSNTLLTTDCNRRAIELFEVGIKDDLINIEGHILQKRRFTAEELASIQQNLDQQGFWGLEVEYITHGGREFWGDLSVKPIIFGAQRFNLVRVADISDRKQAEFALQKLNEELEQRVQKRTEQLSQSEERLRLALMASKQGLYDLDLQTGQIITSPEYATMLGYNPETFRETYEKWIARLHPDDLESVFNTYQAYITKAIPDYQIEFRQRTQAGCWKWVSDIGKIVAWDEAGRPLRMLGIHADIDDRKQAESALLQLNSELEQRIQERTFDLEQALQAADSANQAKSAFLANMSHELRTPLNVILGFAQLLSSDPTLKTKQRDYIRIMHRSGNHLLHLINDILDLSKIEANRITVEATNIDLIEFLDELQAMFWERTTDKELTFTLELDPNLPQYVVVDPNRLRQILINLLSNAIKFTQYGGVILRVSSQTNPIDEPTQIASPSDPTALSAPLPSLCFEVIDTGVGIAPEEQETIFEAFTQARAGKISLEGTGLGLAISHKIVGLLEGELTVQSTLGQGSCFRFSIPLRSTDTTESLGAAPQRAITSLAPDQPSYRILVVDDRSDNRQLLVKLLMQIGLEVQEAANGVEAIARWQHWQPHLIWMDLQMPEMDGCEAIRRIRSEEAARSDQSINDTIIIALTAQASSDIRSRAIAAGCDEFMSKPIQNDLVLTKMAEHLKLRYRYAQLEDKSQTAVKKQPLDITLSTPFGLETKALDVMPAEWIMALHLAALNCDAAETSLLIQQIPSEQNSLITTLSNLVHDYQFEVIVRMTQRNTQ